MISSNTVAKRLIDLASEVDQTLTPMQVLKLSYIAHGWMLGLYHRALIRDEIQAWQYGPVIPRLYNALRKYKGSPVESVTVPDGEALSEKEDHIVQQTFDRYGELSGPALSRITHAKGTPWDLTYNPGSFGLTISDDLIEDHYAAMAD